jgi:hypothetical protein
MGATETRQGLAAAVLAAVDGWVDISKYAKRGVENVVSKKKPPTQKRQRLDWLHLVGRGGFEPPTPTV